MAIVRRVPSITYSISTSTKKGYSLMCLFATSCSLWVVTITSCVMQCLKEVCFRCNVIIVRKARLTCYQPYKKTAIPNLALLIALPPKKETGSAGGDARGSATANFPSKASMDTAEVNDRTSLGSETSVNKTIKTIVQINLGL